MLQRLWELRYRVPLTALGGAVIAGALAVRATYGRGELDLVLNAAAAIALLLVLGAVAMVLAASAYLRLRMRGSRGINDLELESGVRAVTGFDFPRIFAWPMVQVRLEWAAPRDTLVTIEQAGGFSQEVVTPLRRGRHGRVKRRFVVADIFGLARFALVRSDVQSVRIAPGSAHATANTLLQFGSGDGISHPAGPALGDMLDMRRYCYGDALRHVLWKAFARSRQLLVRTPEHAIVPSASATAYLVAGRDDEATAGVARLFLQQRMLGEEFVFAADGAKRPTSDPDEAVEQIIDSVHAVGHGAAGLAPFVQANGPRHGRQLILFVPPSGGLWLQRVEHLAAKLTDATVIVAIDDDLQTDPRPLVTRLLFGQARRASRVHRTLPLVVRRLVRCGCTVRVLHRPSGELVPLAFVEALA